MKKSGSSEAHKLFVLAGPTGRIDRRVTAVRGDLACLSLADRVFAPHYAQPLASHCTAPFTALRTDATGESEAVGELLKGEDFALLDRIGDWAWGQASDRSCGFVRSADLGDGAGTTAKVEYADAASFAEAMIGRPHANGGQGGAGFCDAGLLRRAALAAGADIPAFADLQLESPALNAAARPDRSVFLFAGDLAAICVSPAEAITALPGKGVVRLPIADLLAIAGVDEALYRTAP